MSAFYVHIPFCRQACRYCDFHFAVSLSYREEMFEAMIREIEMRKDEYEGDLFSSLYFGGGTPSIMTEKELVKLMETIFKNYQFDRSAEISLEANPDDISRESISSFQKNGINRLSLGVQSFRDEDLKLMRRSHNAQQAIAAIRIAQESGLTNINMDLIYGIPGMKLADWQKNVERTIDLEIKHISAYHLTYESGTVFDHWRKKGRLVPISDEEGLEQFGLLKDMTSGEGFIHYEISNFGKEGYFSKHNISYWKQVPYIGIGPSAHSFFENTRKWNISNNKKYISMIMNNDPYYSEYEILDKKDRYNEYLLTSLRTMWGIDLDEIQQGYGLNYVKYTQRVADLFLRTGELMKNGSKIRLTKKGIFLADYVVREFFILDDLEKIN